MSDEAELAAQLAQLLVDLRPQSLAALRHALAVSSIPGVGGTLIVHIPSNDKDKADVAFVTGKARLTLES